MVFEKSIVGNRLYLSTVMPEIMDKNVLGMLENNVIDGLLNCSLVRVGKDGTVRYDITNLRSLAELKKTPFRKDRLLNFIDSFVTAYENTENYLLPAENLLLRDDTVFYDIKTEKVKILCLPFENQEPVSFLEFIRRQIFTLQFSADEDNRYFMNIVNAYNSGSIRTVDDLKKLVKTMRIADQKEKKAGMRQRPIPNNAGQTSLQPIGKPGMGNQSAGTDMIPAQQPKPEKKKGLFGKKTDTKEKSKKRDQKAAAPAPQMGIPGMAVPGAPTPNPVKGGMVDPGMAIPGGAIPGGMPIPGGMAPQQEPAKKKGLFGGKEKAKKQPKETKQQIPVQTPVSAAPVPSQLDFGNTIMPEMPNRSTDVTTILEQQSTGGVLTRISNGQQMYIAKDVFYIGKSAKDVDFYVGDNGTVSRIHARIQHMPDGYYISDNGSTNGTFVNGMRLGQGNGVKLKNNDEIRCSDVLFRFGYGN